MKGDGQTVEQIATMMCLKSITSEDEINLLNIKAELL